jgi:hypothetical protein
MKDETDEEEIEDITDMVLDLMSPADLANHEVLQGLERLVTLAQSGNADAIRMFHSTTCRMVQRLNKFHIDHAAASLEWPVLLPQDRDARELVTKQANAMRIGSVRGAGAGAGKGSRDLLNYDSQKGFSIENLRRMNFARAILRPIPSAYEYEEMEEAVGEISPQIKATMDNPTVFAANTRIENFGEQLLLDISNLPDYTSDTREDWICVMVAVLRRNSHLVPKKFRDNQRKVEIYSRKNRQGDSVDFSDTSWRGGILALTLRAGLETVSAVPGVWGQ